jgi:hypothetical protein
MQVSSGIGSSPLSGAVELEDAEAILLGWPQAKLVAPPRPVAVAHAERGLGKPGNRGSEVVGCANRAR